MVSFVATLGAEAAEPKRILLLHSFSRDFKPWSEYAKHIRGELDRQSPWPLDVHDHTFITARFSDDDTEGPFIDYLRALYAKHPLDLIVTIGAPAAGFVQRHRSQAFPSTPMLLTGVEQRRIESSRLTLNDAVVAVSVDFSGVVEDILQVLPDTNHIAVVVGSSPIEKYWMDQVRNELMRFEDRVKFTWYKDFSFEEILKHAAALPPKSALLFLLMAVDTAGVLHEEGRALTRLHAVTNAPIFTYSDAFFGHEIVGGRLLPVSEIGRQAAEVAVRILGGERAGDIKIPPVGVGAPKFDWREMQRWGISEALLPAGSVVEFRVPTVFQQYRWYIAAAAAVCLLQAVFILVLLLNRRRLKREHLARQRAEESALDFSGRLISAQEDERSRLARELHDDVTQRLALLAIDAGRSEREGNKADENAMRAVREGLIRLSEDVHSLSYRLHPSVLDDLGLIEALKAECERFSRIESIPVDIKVQDGFGSPPRQIALCLFRIAQEALRNVGRHAKAKTAEVSLRSLDNGIQLCVRDDGVGFDDRHHRDRPSLGLASMRQRIYLVGGELDIDSSPGHGTIVLAWVPVREERREASARFAG